MNLVGGCPLFCQIEPCSPSQLNHPESRPSVTTVHKTATWQVVVVGTQVRFMHRPRPEEEEVTPSQEESAVKEQAAEAAVDVKRKPEINNDGKHKASRGNGKKKKATAQKKKAEKAEKADKELPMYKVWTSVEAIKSAVGKQKFSEDTVRHLPEAQKISALVTFIIGEMKEEVEGEAEWTNSDAMNFLTLHSTSSLYNMINKSEIQHHAGVMLEQQENGQLGNVTDLFNMSELNEMMLQPVISGNDVANLLKPWFERYYSTAYHAIMSKVRARTWVTEEIDAIMSLQLGTIDGMPNYKSTLPKYVGPEAQVSRYAKTTRGVATKMMEATITEAEEMKITIRNATVGPIMSTRPAQCLNDGVKSLSHGGYLTFPEGSTVQKAITDGKLIGDDGSSRPSPISKVTETKNSEGGYDITLVSNDRDGLKAVAAYVFTSWPLWTTAIPKSNPTLQYNVDLPSSSYEGPRPLVHNFGIDTIPQGNYTELRQIVYDGIDKALGRLEIREDHRKRMKASMLDMENYPLYEVMMKPAAFDKLIERTRVTPDQYRYAPKSASRSNTTRGFVLTLGRSRQSRSGQGEEVAYEAMQALDRTMCQNSHVCKFGKKKEEAPQTFNAEQIREMCSIEKHDGEWTRIKIRVQTSYLRPSNLQNSHTIGLAKPAPWFSWMKDVKAKLTWEPDDTSTMECVMLVYTTEASNTNKTELVLELNAALAAIQNGTAPPPFRVDYQEVTYNGQQTKATVLSSKPHYHPRLLRLLPALRGVLREAKIHQNPHLYGTFPVPLIQTSNPAQQKGLEEAIRRQQEYLRNRVVMSVIGIDKSVDLTAVVPRESGMRGMEGISETNRLSISSLILAGNVVVKDKVLQSPAVRISYTGKQWDIEGDRTMHGELHAYMKEIVTTYLPRYLEGLSNVRAPTLISKYREEPTTIDLSNVIPPQPNIAEEPEGRPATFEERPTDPEARYGGAPSPAQATASTNEGDTNVILPSTEETDVAGQVQQQSDTQTSQDDTQTVQSEPMNVQEELKTMAGELITVRKEVEEIAVRLRSSQEESAKMFQQLRSAQSLNQKMYERMQSMTGAMEQIMKSQQESLEDSQRGRLHTTQEIVNTGTELRREAAERHEQLRKEIEQSVTKILGVISEKEAARHRYDSDKTDQLREFLNGRLAALCSEFQTMQVNGLEVIRDDLQTIMRNINHGVVEGNDALWKCMFRAMGGEDSDSIQSEPTYPEQSAARREAGTMVMSRIIDEARKAGLVTKKKGEAEDGANEEREVDTKVAAAQQAPQEEDSNPTDYDATTPLTRPHEPNQSATSEAYLPNPPVTDQTVESEGISKLQLQLFQATNEMQYVNDVDSPLPCGDDTSQVHAEKMNLLTQEAQSPSDQSDLESTWPQWQCCMCDGPPGKKHEQTKCLYCGFNCHQQCLYEDTYGCPTCHSMLGTSSESSAVDSDQEYSINLRIKTSESGKSPPTRQRRGNQSYKGESEPPHSSMSDEVLNPTELEPNSLRTKSTDESEPSKRQTKLKYQPTNNE